MTKKQQQYFQDVITDIVTELADTLIRKQLDYGPSAINRFGSQGITIRASDKLERLINLQQLKKTPDVAESVEDTLLDLAGYSILGIVIERLGALPPVKQKEQKQMVH